MKRSISSRFMNQNKDLSSPIEYKKIGRSYFTFTELICHSDYGNIWLGFLHEKKNERLVIKEISKKELIHRFLCPSFLNELKIISKNRNSYFLCPLLFAFHDFDSIYMVTPFYSEFIMACLILSLQALHQDGRIHLRLDPSHVIFEENGYCHLIGFRCTMDINESETENLFKMNDVNEYTAPELVMRIPPTFVTDYFSLGLILFEMMTRKSPLNDSFVKSKHVEIINRQVQIKKSDLPEEWSLESADFVNKLIQKQPENRLGSNGFEEIIQHPWLNDLPWQKIKDRLLMSPFKAKIVGFGKLKKITKVLKPKSIPFFEEIEAEEKFSKEMKLLDNFYFPQ